MLKLFSLEELLRKTFPTDRVKNVISYYLCSNLIQNHSRNMEERPQTCKTYSKSFPSCLNLGYLKFHVGEKSCKYNLCKKHFRRPSYLTSHRRLHSEKTPLTHKECGHRCSECLHLTKNNRTDPREEAYWCSKSAKAFKELSLHRIYNEIHPLINPTRYEKCKINLRSTLNLTINTILSTVRKSYTCEECGKWLQNYPNSSRHQRIHTWEKSYKCKDCCRSFAYHSSHKGYHRTTVRNLTDVKNVPSPLPRSRIWKFTTESILVTNLTDLKNVANPLPIIQHFKLTTESIQKGNLINMKHVEISFPGLKSSSSPQNPFLW